MVDNPTYNIIKVENTFGKPQRSNIEDVSYLMIRVPSNPSIQPHITTTSLKKSPILPPIHVNQDNLQKLVDIFKIFDEQSKQHPGFNAELERVRKYINPYENVGESLLLRGQKGKPRVSELRSDGYEVGPPFITRAAIKLAEIDATFGLTAEKGFYSYFQHRLPSIVGIPGAEKYTAEELKIDRSNPDPNKLFTFCDIAGGPGSFTQYLQFRRPDSIGYGISLDRNDSFSWNREKLNLSTEADPVGLVIVKGRSGIGNLYTDYEDFIQRVYQSFPNGVHLAVADGGICIKYDDDDDNNPNNPIYTLNPNIKEVFNSRLIIIEFLTGISVLQEGRHLVVKVYKTYSEFTIQLLYLVWLCFEEGSLFKPISSRPGSQELYVVLKRRRRNIDIQAPLNIIRKAILEYRNDTNVSPDDILHTYDEAVQSGFITNVFVNNLIDPREVPNDFREYVIKINNLMNLERISQKEFMLQMIASPESVNIPQYNLQKALLVWNLPQSS